MTEPATPIDLLVDAWYVVTMNAAREIIHRGSVAVGGGAIVDVGKTADLERRYAPTRRIGGERFVLTPGLVNTHIHITGEPLTRGYVPDDTPFEENVFVWLTNLYAAHEEGDERCSAQLAATEMLRTGTTTFLEAGTIRLLDEVVDGLAETAGGSGRGCGTCRPSPTCTARTPMPRSRASRINSPATAARPMGASLHGRRSWATPRAPIRCGGRPASWPTSTESA